MSSDNQSSPFVSHLLDLLQTIGPVTSKRMFGGYGFFLDGLMFALMADNTFYLKADHENVDDFTALGLEDFSYVKKGKTMHISYYQAPEEALEDLEVMSVWANSAFAAALRANAKKQIKGKKHAT